MKKILFFIIVCCGVSFSFSSCNKGKSAEELREDSIRRADSLAAVAAFEAEQARLDSIRQDSIKKAEAAAGMSLSTFCKSFKEDGFRRGYTFKDEKNILSTLKSLGFEVTQKTERRSDEICGSWETWTATEYTCTKMTSAGITTVIVNPDDGNTYVSISFPTDYDRETFMKSFFSAGYKLSRGYDTEYYGGGKYYENPSDCYYDGANIIVNGNEIKMIQLWEC